MPITGSQTALMYAQSGVIRSGASRSGYHSPKVFVSIDGVHYATARATSAERVLHGSLTISDILDETPNTATFRVRGFEPTTGQDVVIALGSKNTLTRLFAGPILSVQAVYEGTPGNAQFDVRAIDYTWHLTRKRISKKYTNQSASAIAIDLVSQVDGFTSASVESGLDTIDEITFTNETVMSALLRLAKRIGAYVDVDELKDVHFGVTSGVETDPVDIGDSGNVSQTAVTVNRDMSQVVTRVLVEGGGVNALAACAVGETILPVQDVAWYSDTGGTVTCGPQRITYAGLREGGAGSLVGPGAAPAGAPALALVAGAGIDTGAHNYAYTFVTGAGESLPSPIGTVTTGTMADPTAAPTFASLNISTAALPVGFYNYAYSWVAGAGETLVSPIAGYHSSGSENPRLSVPLGPSGTTARNIYRSNAVTPFDPSAVLHLIGTISDNTTTTFDDTTASGTSGGATPPVANTTALNRVTVSSIGIGGSGTTSRKVYRTAAGGTQLKLLTTIADNTTTSYADSTADSGLGANVPTSDTSGLTQPSGQIIAGATSLLLAGTGAFSSSGGWVIIGNGQQVVRYTGISGSSLTGIPSSGAGAITASISYNSTATAAPCLTGIPSSGDGSILYAILAGDPVNLLVQVDDVEAQATLADLIGGTDDGIVEEYVQDGRISETEARARGEAILALRSDVEASVTWESRDKNTRAGRSITFNITNPTTLAASFKIQQVTISNFQPAMFPTFAASASSTRFSLEDLLRTFRKAEL